MPNYSLLTSEMERILGSENIKGSDEGFSEFAVDGKTPKLIVYPTSSEEISEILRFANEEEASICLRSQGTKIGIGNIPKSIDIVICMSKFCRILEHDFGNLTVTVEAGVKLSELQKVLEDKKQFLPVDPVCSSKASVGGIVASNSNGPRRLRYGSIRDLLIGMKAVLPTGQKIRAGGKVVKNVAGYDMCKLFVGSFGTLGIITEATFKLNPLPEVQKTILLLFENTAQAFEHVSSLLGSVVSPASIVVLNYYALNFLSSKVGITSTEKMCCLAIRLEGFDESVQREYDEVQKMRVSYTQTLEGTEQDKFWAALSDFYCISGSNFSFKGSVPLSITSNLFRRVEENSKNLEFSTNIISHAGSGIIYVFFSTQELKKPIQLINELVFYIEKEGGYFVVESAPSEIKKKINVWSYFPGGMKIMQDIKKKFDPGGILNPGRLV